MRNKTLWTAILGAVVLVAATAFVPWRDDGGKARFFADQAYHAQTLRALSAAASGGAEPSEVLEAIRGVRASDAEGWYVAWSALGERVTERASRIVDARARGMAKLRSHGYFRTAEFFLDPADPRRRTVFAKNVEAFYAGLDDIGVRYERIRAPYGRNYLNAVYYPGGPGAETKPLIVMCGGFDSTLEELYFVLVRAALERGYSVLTYEGPGQGAVLREQGLPFTHEWEKPTAAVLDEFFSHHPKPETMVLVGMSLGGYLAPRVAAHDKRFAGVVAYGVLYDFGEVARHNSPTAIGWMRDAGLNGLVEWLAAAKARMSPSFAWGLANGKWVMGTSSVGATISAMEQYTLARVAHRIESDVLILAGAEDHFIPIGQVDAFARSLVNARSVATRVYDRASGGAEHCQLGAFSLWHADFFDWLQGKFEQAGRV